MSMRSKERKNETMIRQRSTALKKRMVNEKNTPETRKNDATITVESDDNSDRENAHKQWSVVSDEGGG